MISGALTVVACLLIWAVNAIESHLQYSASAVLALFAVAAIIFCFWGHKTRVQIESDDDDEESVYCVAIRGSLGAGEERGFPGVSLHCHCILHCCAVLTSSPPDHGQGELTPPQEAPLPQPECHKTPPPSTSRVLLLLFF